MVVLTNKKAVGAFSLVLAVIITIISGSYFLMVVAEETSATTTGTTLPIIMYHSILDNDNRKGKYVVTPSQLESDFEHIRTQGYTPITTAQLIAYANGTGSLPEKPILITFDDGYFNNYSYLFPMLQKFNFSALINITGTYTETYSTDEEPGNNNYSNLTWDEIKEMHGSGLVEFGNHTWDLHDRTRRRGVLRKRGESEEEYERMLIADVTKLNERLEELLGARPQVFAYPFGNMNDKSQEIIANIGFAITLGCAEKVNNITGPESLINLGRYNRSGNVSTERFFSQFEK